SPVPRAACPGLAWGQASWSVLLSGRGATVKTRSRVRDYARPAAGLSRRPRRAVCSLPAIFSSRLFFLSGPVALRQLPPDEIHSGWAKGTSGVLVVHPG